MMPRGCLSAPLAVAVAILPAPMLACQLAPPLSLPSFRPVARNEQPAAPSGSWRPITRTLTLYHSRGPQVGV